VGGAPYKRDGEPEKGERGVPGLLLGRGPMGVGGLGINWVGIDWVLGSMWGIWIGWGLVVWISRAGVGS
jgi:hypothetical protein